MHRTADVSTCRPSSVRSRWRIAALVALLCGGAACALLGPSVPISPGISGSLSDAGGPVREGRMLLLVRARGPGDTVGVAKSALDADGRFSFAPLQRRGGDAKVARHYVLDLVHERDDSQRTVFRMRYAGDQLRVPVHLACHLDRELAEGPPCELQAPVAAHPWFLQAGARAFAEHCAVCHGADARGDGPMAPTLHTPPADLTRIAARRRGDFPAAEIAQTIDGRFAPREHGTREMPIWGDLLGGPWVPGPDREALVRGTIETLIAYLESIQEPPIGAYAAPSE